MKWWIWAIIVLVILGAIGGITAYFVTGSNAAAQQKASWLGPNAPDASVYPSVYAAQRTSDQKWQVVLTRQTTSSNGAHQSVTETYNQPYAIIYNLTLGATSDMTVFTNAQDAISYYKTAYNASAPNKSYKLFPSGVANSVYDNASFTPGDHA